MPGQKHSAKKTNEQCKKKMQAHTKKVDVKTAKKQIWTPRNMKEERPIKVNVENDKQSKT
jgi:hypothetical protein